MGKTRGLYKAEFPEGTTVRIEDAAVLAEFMRSWKYHHPLTASQLDYASRTCEVESVAFYHGGNELYQLKGIQGIWHECCLKSLQGQS